MQHRKLQKIGHPDLRAYASTNENGYGIVSQSPKNLKVMPDTTQSLEVVAESEQNNMGNQLMDVESLGGHLPDDKISSQSTRVQAKSKSVENYSQFTKPQNSS